MRMLVFRPLGILALVLLAWGVLHIWTRAEAVEELRQAHNRSVVLFGDSHARDVRLPGAARFAGSGQDLVGTWMWMDAFERAGGMDSKVKVVVLTLWPDKFVPLAERRLSGRVQEDGWGKSVLGRAGPVLSLAHMVESALPWRLRWRLWLHAFQLRKSMRDKGWSCRDNPVPPDYGFKMGTQVIQEDWFEAAKVSRWALAQIVALAERSDWQLVLLEHPLHPSFLSQVNPKALADYEAEMRAAAVHPSIAYLDMARVPMPYTAFRDHHHLTCEGSEKVAERLYPLLRKMGVSP
ncbi:MAG: hypothetical protein P8P45_03095 [Flavobacteriales bacterium]|nr:hypothetical protein [Flavobacteriales bacterium]